MTDFEKLKIALKAMQEAEGKTETNKLMWRSLRASDATVYDMAQELSEKVCQAQHELGVQNTSCGVKMGSEILAKIGMLMLHLEEKEG
jgi:hypothetical protein